MMNDDYYPTACDDVVWENWAKIMRQDKKSITADDIIKEFCERLDTMLNGDVVNDTMIRHFKKAAVNLSGDNEAFKAILKSGVDSPERDWILFAVVMMSAGPLDKEEMTEEFKEGMKMFAKEHGMEDRIKG